METNFRKQILGIIIGISLVMNLKSQTISPQSINSAGIAGQPSNGSLSFTVGELVVLSETDSGGNTLGNGFTSSAASVVTAILEPDASLLNVKVYPNPTSDMLYVDIVTTKLEWVYAEITDELGKLVVSEKYAGITNHIGVNSYKWKAGLYFLNLKDSAHNTIGNYKIVKQ